MKKVIEMRQFGFTPDDEAISRHMNNMFSHFGKSKVKSAIKSFYGIDLSVQVDKIALSSDKTSCVVHLVDGSNLYLDFSKLGITYISGLNLIDQILGKTSVVKQAA